jgi:hypothetical protein
LRLFCILLSALLEPACAGPVENHPPKVTWARAVCWPQDEDEVARWRFEAAVTDQDGQADLVEIWADVYDLERGGYVESVLLEWYDAFHWETSRDQGETLLDCDHVFYGVRFVAWDTRGQWNVRWVQPVRITP